jgi:hypothetical protein
MCSFLNVLNQNLNLKFYQIFLFEFFDIHMIKQTTTSHDSHGFKWQNLNFLKILTSFVCSPTFFLGLLNYDCTLIYVVGNAQGVSHWSSSHLAISSDQCFFMSHKEMQLHLHLMGKYIGNFPISHFICPFIIKHCICLFTS